MHVTTGSMSMGNGRRSKCSAPSWTALIHQMTPMERSVRVPATGTYVCYLSCWRLSSVHWKVESLLHQTCLKLLRNLPPHDNHITNTLPPSSIHTLSCFLPSTLLPSTLLPSTLLPSTLPPLPGHTWGISQLLLRCECLNRQRCILWPYDAKRLEAVGYTKLIGYQQ